MFRLRRALTVTLVLAGLILGAGNIGCSRDPVVDSGPPLDRALSALTQNDWEDAIHLLETAFTQSSAVQPSENSADQVVGRGSDEAVTAKVMESLVWVTQADIYSRLTQIYLDCADSRAAAGQGGSSDLVQKARGTHAQSQQLQQSAQAAVDYVLGNYRGHSPQVDLPNYKVIMEDQASYIYEYLAEHGQTQRPSDLDRAVSEDLNFGFAGSMLYAMGYNPEDISGTPRLTGTVQWPAYFCLMGIALNDPDALNQVLELTKGDPNNPFRQEAMKALDEGAPPS